MQAFSNSMEQFGKNMEEFANNMEQFLKGFNEDKLKTINDFKQCLNSNASKKFVFGNSLYCKEVRGNAICDFKLNQLFKGIYKIDPRIDGSGPASDSV